MVPGRILSPSGRQDAKRDVGDAFSPYNRHACCSLAVPCGPTLVSGAATGQ